MNCLGFIGSFPSDKHINTGFRNSFDTLLLSLRTLYTSRKVRPPSKTVMHLYYSKKSSNYIEHNNLQ